MRDRGKTCVFAAGGSLPLIRPAGSNSWAMKWRHHFAERPVIMRTLMRSPL